MSDWFCDDERIKEPFEIAVVRKLTCICSEFQELNRLIRRIFFQPFSSRLSFITNKGEFDMPLTVLITDPPGVAKYQEFNAEGAPVNPLGTVQYASDNEAVATVDPNTGQLAYVGEGTCTIAGGDSGVADGLPASDTLTVMPAATDVTPVSSTMTLTAGSVPAPTPTATAAKRAPLTPGKKV